MKNSIKTFGLIFIIIISTSCTHNRQPDVQRDSFDYGHVENNIYQNAYFDFNIKLPISGVVQSQEQTQYIANTGKELITGDDDCNLLAIYSEQPEHLELLGCRKGNGQTIKYADYKVTGTHALELEKYLVEKYGMGNLIFMCCGWEPKDGQVGMIKNSELKKDNEYYSLSITMYGNAEKKDEKGSVYIEMDRTKIDFIVTVTLDYI